MAATSHSLLLQKPTGQHLHRNRPASLTQHKGPFSCVFFHFLPRAQPSQQQAPSDPLEFCTSRSQKHSTNRIIFSFSFSLSFRKMASSLSTTASSSSFSAVTKTATSFPPHSSRRLSKVSFRLLPKPKLLFFTKGLPPSRSSRIVVKAQSDKVAAGGSSNAEGTPVEKYEASVVEAKDVKPSNEPSSTGLATEESISEFFTQVASLVKLVDSRDIVELQLKQLDCEVIIRKKEAFAQPQSPVPVVTQSPPPSVIAPVYSAPVPAPASAPAPAASPAPSPSPPPGKSAKSSLPPFKCPMAGTFYRSSAPGEPPFVKVGDKVLKGQVICIIEAMKLMNEIEADQSGTVVEILAEDGKPVSVDMPLFVIQP